MIAIFAALNAEVSSLKKGMSISKSTVQQDCRLFEGQYRQRECILVLTGIGKRCAQQVVAMALEKYSITHLISTGFSGALNHKTTIGDIVVYSELVCGNDGKPTEKAQEILKPDQELMSVSVKSLTESGLHSIIGKGVTLESVCSTPEAKEALGKKFQADSVDMESYWLGQAAQMKKMPFITVRSIFDTVQDDLTFLSQISHDGKIHQREAMVQFLKHPGQVRDLTHYFRNAQKAESNLAVFLQRMVEAIQK